ncbi:MAG TPA: molybdate ABC transporter substrate-binding protein [Acidobacteriota bacterium]|nr:molybdate ABC transporter substrate-binding protein [Acidobacteriota bacterium]
MTACGGTSSDTNGEVLVFAAASLRDALQEIATGFETETSVSIVLNFAGSNVLARQIEASPIADVFISADERWMDYIANLGLVAAGTRAPLLGNRLVVVAHSDNGLSLEEVTELAEANFSFLSLADPDAVPAGRYARETLQGIQAGATDLWSQVSNRVAPAPDVRAALALVEARPDVIGIVYRTDALTSPRVRVALELPAGAGPVIRYASAAIGKQPTAAAIRWLEFLRGETARGVLERHGFLTLGSD